VQPFRGSVLFCRVLSERLGRQWKRREDSYCGQNDAGCLSLFGGEPVGNQQSESRAKKGARSRYENQFRNGLRDGREDGAAKTGTRNGLSRIWLNRLSWKDRSPY
jgi:hypothetical protein